MRRGSYLQLGLFVLGAAVITTLVAVLIPWLPVQASREAGRIDFTFWFMTGISIFVFAIVAAVLLYEILHFRAKPDDWSDGPPVHGHTGLEILWTVIPFVLVTAVMIVSAIVLHENAKAGADPLRVTAIAQQFAWQFKYPNGVVTPELRLPLDRGMVLTLTAKDVLHSFWVPEFRQKQDAVPGLATEIVITPTRTGTFPVICVELCGLGHSTMRSEAIVMTKADYDRWYAGSKEAAAGGGGAGGAAGGGGGGGGGGAQAGLAVFNQNGCNACHTFAAAKATGKVGPDLDHLKAAADKAGMPLEEFIKESIVNPDAEIAQGYAKGVMPGTFGQTISGPALDQLVQYLASNQP